MLLGIYTCPYHTLLIYFMHPTYALSLEPISYRSATPIGLSQTADGIIRTPAFADTGIEQGLKILLS